MSMVLAILSGAVTLIGTLFTIWRVGEGYQRQKLLEKQPDTIDEVIKYLDRYLVLHVMNHRPQDGSNVVRFTNTLERFGLLIKQKEIKESLSVKAILHQDLKSLAKQFSLGWDNESHMYIPERMNYDSINSSIVILHRRIGYIMKDYEDNKKKESSFWKELIEENKR